MPLLGFLTHETLFFISYTIFATHMEDLSELATIYPNVKILHFEVDLRNNRLDFKVVFFGSLGIIMWAPLCALTFLITYQFHLKDGPRHVPHYGLLLAGVAGLPSSVIEAARDITVRITEEEVKRMDINCEEHHSIQTVYQVVQKLICLKYSNQGEDYIRQAIQNIKEGFKEGSLIC